jgi:hypothetical protein
MRVLIFLARILKRRLSVSDERGEAEVNKKL